MKMKYDCIRKFKDRTIPRRLKTAIGAYWVNSRWRNRGKLLNILLVTKQAIFKSCKAPLKAAVSPPMQNLLTKTADNWKELNALTA